MTDDENMVAHIAVVSMDIDEQRHGQLMALLGSVAKPMNARREKASSII